MRTLSFIFIFTAAATALAARPTRLHIPVERYTLPNGLAVVLHEDHRLPTVVVDILFRVGSKDERPGRTGFAHLFEHLMFMGTRNVPNGDYDKLMESVGGRNDAWTSDDLTNYYEIGPSNMLETFLWLEADRLSSLPDDMTQAKVDLQRDVVKNERRQSSENRPYGRVQLVLPEQLYPASHPYHHPVIGSHEDLDAAGAEDVKAFFRQFYVPGNASLVVSGDFTPAQAKQLIDKYFGWMPKAPAPTHAAPAPVTLDKPVRLTLTDKVQLPRVVLAWHSPASYTDGDTAMQLLAALLGGGDASRLHRALVYERKLAESVQVWQDERRYGSALQIQATALSGHTSAELEQALGEELDKLLTTAPVKAEELEQARAFVQTQVLRWAVSPVGLAASLNLYEYGLGDASQLERRMLGRYDSVTVAGLMSWARKVLRAPHVTIVVEPAGGAQ
jgi:predicted Zn-dependent peptidase